MVIFSNMDWLNITVMGLLAGVAGTGLGGVVSLLFSRPGPRFMGGVLAFSAGVMLAVVFLGLIPESVEASGTAAALAGLALGLVAFLALDNYVPHRHFLSGTDGPEAVYLKKGVLLALGIALHNFPEGLAIGAGYAGSAELGFSLTVLIALHNIPEGMAVAAPLRYGGYGRARAVLASALAGAPMAVGALAGALVGGVSSLALGVSLGFAAGAMLYIVCDELIPDAYQTAGAHLSSAGIFAGVAAGLFIA